MVATWNPAANCSYYLQQSDYYLADGEPQGVWFAPAESFGFRDGAAVDAAQFSTLFAGRGPNSESLLSNHQRADRIPAFDVTLSAPRSVSLLWAFGDATTRAAIEHAQARAARATLNLLQVEATYARRGKGGQHYERVPLSAACFQHGDSRPAEHADGRVFGDPNLHTHCVILNLAERADGTVGALHSPVLRDWKMAAGATYHLALSQELRALGFGIDRIGRNGTFEIVGIDETFIEYFSARRTEIEQELAELGTTSAESGALAAAVTRSTRQSKREQPMPTREAVWREAAISNSLNVGTIGREARDAAMASGTPMRTIDEQLAGIPRELTETRSVFDRRDLLRVTAAALVGTEASVAVVAQHVDGLIAQGHVVALGTDAVGQSRYSTPEMICIEREIVDDAARLTRSPWRRLSPEAVRHHCQHRGLHTEQVAAALAATEAHRIAVIEGAPGSGKTTTLAPIVEAYLEAGCRVVGAASAWRVANMLRDDLSIPSRAVASWLDQERHGKPFLNASTVLIVDEAGLLSSRETHALLHAVKRAGAKLLLVGDRDQLQAIGAGSGLSLVARAAAQAKVSTIVRQHDTWARDAITAFGRGDALAALASFADHGCLLEANGARAAIRALVDGWERSARDHPAAPRLLLAQSNAEVAAISHEVRSRYRAQGAIRGEDIAVRAVTPSGHTSTLALACGDRIRFLTRQDDLGVINGTTATVVRVSVDGLNHVQIEAGAEGRHIVFRPEDLADEKGRARLGYAYASTFYGAQGLTVDHAAVLLTPHMDRHAMYVAASRARQATTLVVDTKRIDHEIALTHTPYADAPCPSAAERRAWLASRVSRASRKESTLEVIEIEAIRQAGLGREWERSREAGAAFER